MKSAQLLLQFCFPFFPVWLSWEVEAQEVVFLPSWNLNCQENPFGLICFMFLLYCFFLRPVCFSFDGIYTIACTYFLCNYFTYCILWCIYCICVFNIMEKERRVRGKGNKTKNCVWITHFFLLRSRWHIGGRLREKVQKNERGAIYDMRTNLEMLMQLLNA